MAAVPQAVRADVASAKDLLRAMRDGAPPKAFCDALIAMLGKYGVVAGEVVSYFRDCVASGADKDRVTSALVPFVNAPELADYRARPAKEAAYIASEKAAASNIAMQADLLLASGTIDELEYVRVQIVDKIHSPYWVEAVPKHDLIVARQEELVAERRAAEEASLLALEAENTAKLAKLAEAEAAALEAARAEAQPAEEDKKLTDEVTVG